MKKIGYVLILVSFFLLGFSFSTKVFSEEAVEMKIIKSSSGHNMIKVYGPSSLQQVYVEIFHKDTDLLAGVHVDYYVLEKLNGSERNVFLINTKYFGNRKDIIFKMFPGSAREEKFRLSDLEEIYVEDGQPNTMEQINGLNIMSFNIHHGKNKLGFYTLDHIGKLIIDHQIDIVGLQEVDKYVVRSKFEDQVKKIASETSMYYAFAPNMRLMGAEYGNAILSKYPIESYQNVKLPGFREKRGLLVSKIHVGDQTINFLVTHLGLTKEEKLNQFNVLRQYVEYFGEKTILVGDFNSRPDHEGIQQIKYQLIDAAADTEEYYQHTYDGIVIKNRIDYIFISPDMKATNYKVIDTNISDHLPVIASIEI
ncbi:endonuclease/exonuclease/phosphatase family metal-dependent hydrolase [Anaerosolibacter carboniphilus]|uniref:Endonuclease/exonuclease/phosphatase family metal-dependent hydrolase n=1 Tax=Anaerosolibacter carboniphilus TaxID=1417629 RepID=A0A841L6A9_9FIRM|nr:endonuclease/exonuclease/phosphatase family protein [Anaerosolibacter carboniphilus]MBB6217929.1 endonuclease/exonuclease/phosphatase family metal-dependent hydrolase [Anaerosolibacter carboniphilus]